MSLTVTKGGKMSGPLRVQIPEKKTGRREAGGEPARFARELVQRTTQAGGHARVLEGADRYGPALALEVLLALGSAGAFTVFYQTIAAYLKRDEGRELTLEKGDVRITLKGRNLPEELALIRKLAPELLPQAGEQGSEGRNE
jgi:hypothetical protein